MYNPIVCKSNICQDIFMLFFILVFSDVLFTHQPFQKLNFKETLSSPALVFH